MGFQNSTSSSDLGSLQNSAGNVFFKFISSEETMSISILESRTGFGPFN